MLDLSSSPTGRTVPTYDGARAFVPNPLPREIYLPPQLVYQLDKASRAVASLSGIGETLPNPHLLIRPFLRREAVLSSMIEGTQTSISELFLFEASTPRKGSDRYSEAREVANYVRALEFGLAKLAELPLSVRLFNDIHRVLMQDVRGRDRHPGELRSEQVWIGSEGTSIGEARFIPPPSGFVRDALTDLEYFLNEQMIMPPLIQCCLMHYQFEAIHPYSDGNGRVGRLLIVLFLCAKGVLTSPLLYLSAYLERNRQRYYDLLLRISATGDWLSWIEFLLEGFEEQANDAIVRSRRVRTLHDMYRHTLHDARASGNALKLIDEFFETPFISVTQAKERLGITYVGAKGVLSKLQSLGMIRPAGVRGQSLFVANELLQIIEAPIASKVAT